MSFRQDVEEIPGLERAYRPGLQALPARDKKKIKTVSPRNVTGSVFVERELKKLARFKNAHLWDYVVEWKNAGQNGTLYWIEVHPADGAGAVGELNAKLAWLMGWLRDEGKKLGFTGGR